MDPTPTEANAWAKISDAAEWVGMSKELLAAVFKYMGLPKDPMFRQLVNIPIDLWNTTVPRIQVPDEDAEVVEGAPPPTRPLLPAEVGFVGSLRRCARLRLGAPADEGAPPQSSQTSQLLESLPLLLSQSLSQNQAIAVPGALGPAASKSCARKVKMATVFDQADDSEISVWPDSRVDAAMACFRADNNGKDPYPEEEATGEQIAALEARLSSGGVPCADFAIWRPFGQRLYRKLRLTVMHLTVSGDYVPHEVAGPPDYEAWESAWAVFSMAMRSLDAACRSNLDAYAHKIKRFSQELGPSRWWIIVQADSRMRSEQWTRLKRQAIQEKAAATAEGKSHGFDPKKPWDYVLDMAVRDKDFWYEQLDKKATYYSTHQQTVAQITDPGHGAALGGSSGGSARKPGNSSGKSRKRKAEPAKRGDKGAGREGAGSSSGKGAAFGSGKGAGKSGKHQRTDDNRQICFAWNREDKGCKTPCPANRAHVCELCMSASHRTYEHRSKKSS